MDKNLLSKKAACNSHGQDSSYFLGWQEYEKNPYDPITNPTGIIQMGLAENQLSFDLIESWLENHPNPAGFKRDGASIFRELALFQDYRGFPPFKKALANYMGYLRGNKVRFEPNNLVLAAGATSANETLMFCLAGPGEAFLLPTPYYPGFDRDLKWRTGVEIVPIRCSSSNGFKITKAALEEAYQRAKKCNLGVRGVLITNPSNPLGTTTTRDELDTLLDFVVAKGIHLISDEIYSGTNFGSPGFVSVAEAMIGRDHNVSHRVHIVYSLSKDLGLPGFRVGAIYSKNNSVVAAATKMSSFGLISSHTQYLLSELLSDEGFTRKYTEENRKRLKKRHGQLVEGLRNAGVGCLRSNAGLYCWVDMRHLLESNTFEGEMKLWNKMVYEVGLNISPGSSCHCNEPGWFRVCFANMSADTLNVAIRRLKTFIDSGRRSRPAPERIRVIVFARKKGKPSFGRIHRRISQWSLGDLYRRINGRSSECFESCAVQSDGGCRMNPSYGGFRSYLSCERIIDLFSRHPLSDHTAQLSEHSEFLHPSACMDLKATHCTTNSIFTRRKMNQSLVRKMQPLFHERTIGGPASPQ